MGRSVGQLIDAEDAIYFEFTGHVYGTYNPETDEMEGVEYDALLSRHNWEEFKSELILRLERRYPSLYRPNRPEWRGESQILLKNDLAIFALNEYCDSVCLSIGVNESADYGWDNSAIGKQWIASIYKSIRECLKDLPYTERMVLVAVASNGEAMYRKVED